MRDASFVWNTQNLDRWLTNPDALVPGQNMGFRVEEPQDRADLIAHLVSLSTELARP